MKKIALALSLLFLFNFPSYSQIYTLEKKYTNFETQPIPNSTERKLKVIDFEEEDKTPIISGILSAVIPGSGQIYNQDYIKGTFVFTSFLSLILTEIFYIEPTLKKYQIDGSQNNLFDIFVMLIRISIPSVWLYSWGDAYQSATYEFKKKKKEDKSKFEKLSNNVIQFSFINFKF